MIETLPSYWRGTCFRSRTEARWAVFFDAIGLRWEYEPEGFKLEDGTWYLPDFWLPDMGMWSEVKPASGATDDERRKIEMLVQGSRRRCALLAGAPWPLPVPVCRWGEEGLEWWEECFSDKYTIGRHDGSPRMYFQCLDYEAREQPSTAEAMETARRMDLKDPTAGDYLPTGWEGIEPVV